MKVRNDYNYFNIQNKIKVLITNDQTIVQMARLKLISQHFYRTLDELLIIIDTSQIENVPKEVIDEYRVGRRIRQSNEYSSNPSSRQSSASKASIDMSRIPTRLLESMIRISTIELNFVMIKTFVINNIFRRDESQFNLFFINMSAILIKLRAFFYYLSSISAIGNETSFVQPIFIMFLKKAIKEINFQYEVKNVGNIHYSFCVQVPRNNADEISSKTISGQTDVLLYRDSTSSSSIVSQFELKSPFSSLYQRSSDYQKNQLIGQCFGLRKMKENPDTSTVRNNNKKENTAKFVNGGLTDLFSICTCFSFTTEPQTFYISKSATDVQEFLLLLLLLLIDFDDNKATALHKIFSKPHISKKRKKENGSENESADDIIEVHMKKNKKIESNQNSTTQKSKTKSRNNTLFNNKNKDGNENQCPQNIEQKHNVEYLLITNIFAEYTYENKIENGGEVSLTEDTLMHFPILDPQTRISKLL